MTNKILLFFLFLTFIIVSISNGQQAAFTVQPQFIELEIYPGAQKTFQVLLSNESGQDSNRYKIYATDFCETEDWNYKVLDERTGKYSCTDWLKLDTMEVDLGPRKGKELTFQIRAPYNVKDSRFCAIVFALVPKVTPKEAGAGGASMVFHFRIPVYVLVTVKSPTTTPKPRNVEIKQIEIKSAAEDEEYATYLKKANEVPKNFLVVKTTLINSNNNHIKVKGSLLVKDRKGKRLRQVPLGEGEGLVLPQTLVKFTTVIRRPMPGEYVFEPSVNYGGLAPAIGRIPFTISRNVLVQENSFRSTSAIALDIGREIIDLVVSPSSFRTQLITIRNDEIEPINIKADFKYLKYDENGFIVTSDSGNNQFSCVNWLTIKPQQFVIPPGENKKINVEIKIPESVAPGGRYACLAFDVLRASAKDTSLPTPVQIPVKLTITGVSEKKGEITKVDVSNFNPPNFTVNFKNLGNIHIRPRLKVELKFLPEAPNLGGMKYIGESKAELIGSLIFPDFPVSVLPEGSAKFEQDFDRKLEPGNYVAVVSADFGGTEPAVFVQKFRIK